MSDGQVGGLYNWPLLFKFHTQCVWIELLL